MPALAAHRVWPPVLVRAAPRAVAGSLTRIAVADAHRPRSVGPFDLVGATWSRRDHLSSTRIEVRTRRDARWSRWRRLSVGDGGASAGSRDARSGRGRVTAAPVWVGTGARAVQARTLTAGGDPATAPADLRLVLVNGGSSPADADPVAPHLRSAATIAGGAALSEPTIYSRADWGAEESLRHRNKGCGTPEYAATVKVGFLHHTDTPNGYSRAEVPAIIRSIYRYHVEANGWCDVGYNFLVDRFGRIWEGRYGGVTRPVIGAQAGGLNVGSFGVAMIGDFSSVKPDRAMRRAVTRLFAWRLGIAYRDPTGSARLRADHFNGSRYRAGQHPLFRVVSGHRDADYTDCPGRFGYAALPAIRRAARAEIGAGLVGPVVSGPTSRRFGAAGTVAIRARALRRETWTLDVLDAADRVVDSASSKVASGDRIVAAWRGTTDATGDPPAAAGRYRLVLVPSDHVGAGLPFVTSVTIRPEVTISGPPTAPYSSTVTLGGRAIPGATVTVAVSDQLPVTVAATARGRWSTTFVASADRSWSASAGSGRSAYTTATGHTLVAPAILSPTPRGGVITVASSPVTLSGSALPSSATVEVRDGTTVLGSAPVGVTGSWSATIAVTGTARVRVVDGAGVSSPSYTLKVG
jgi:hypothetical protein